MALNTRFYMMICEPYEFFLLNVDGRDPYSILSLDIDNVVNKNCRKFMHATIFENVFEFEYYKRMKLVKYIL